MVSTDSETGQKVENPMFGNLGPAYPFWRHSVSFFLIPTPFHLLISVLKFMSKNIQVSREYDILYIFPEFLYTSVF